jgi:SAM-dependent methyltransferase
VNPSLQTESEKLARSWMQHEQERLRNYLVSGVEDPRINVQSVLSRHFLIRALAPDRFRELMHEEYRFAAAMNWLLMRTRHLASTEEIEMMLYGLRKGADKVEEIVLPRFLLQAYARLPATAGDVTIPQYIESFLTGATIVDGHLKPDDHVFNTFEQPWSQVLKRSGPEIASAVRQYRVNAPTGSADPNTRLSVLEPACGSANDFRFLRAYGIAEHIDYRGFDLCEKNVENAQKLFEEIRFDFGNVFEIKADDKSFDLCFLHDLFEHLSPEGIEAAAREICRVTKWGICIGFFNTDEIAEHVIQPFEEYHWNRLSMERMRSLFAELGFVAEVIHVGSFLRQRTGCDYTHNPNAYTFILTPAAGLATRGRMVKLDHYSRSA